MTARILVVDGDGELLHYYEQVLSHWDWTAIIARSASEALARAQALRPDAVLADLVMPYANGLDLLRRLKENAALRDVPIIATVAPATDRHDPALRDFDDVLVKPISGLQLVGTLDRLLRERTAWITESASATAA